jgi:dienelactone hydrolase
MKVWAAGAAALLAACSTAPAADVATFDQFAWLVGNWRGESDGAPFYEEWKRVDPLHYSNRNYRICAGQVVGDDRAEILVESGDVVYRSGTLVWHLENASPDRCLFVNREHGESISFQLQPAGTWTAVLTYPSRSIEYQLSRVEPMDSLAAKPFEPLLGWYAGRLSCRDQHLETSLQLEVTRDRSQALVYTPSTLQSAVPAEEVCWDPPFLSLQLADGNRRIRLACVVDGDVIRGKLREGELEIQAEFVRGDTPRAAESTARIEPTSIPRDGGPVNARVFLPRVKTGEKRAGVVIVHGSGQRRIDEYNGWAELLAARGVAVLTYDKRNVTTFPDLNLRERPTDIGRFEDLVSDARAAVGVLAAHAEVDSKRVGILGFSQGAVVAPFVAAADRSLAFVVAVSGNATTDAEFIVYQSDRRLEQHGVAAENRNRARALWAKLFEYTKTRSGADELQRELDRAHEEGWGRWALTRRVPNDDEIAHLMTWNSWELDPAAAWRASSCPALVVLGELDDLVPAKRSAEILTPLFKEAAGAREVRVFAHADHQIRVVPNAGEFAWPRFAPEYLDTIANWIAAR